MSHSIWEFDFHAKEKLILVLWFIFDWDQSGHQIPMSLNSLIVQMVCDAHSE